MKRKFINGLLAVAVMMGTAGSFVSCKDYEEEHYAELQRQITDNQNSLVDIIKQTIVVMNGVTRQEMMDSIAKYACKCMLDNYYTKTQADAKFLTSDQVKTMLNNYYTKQKVDSIFNNYYDKTQLYTKAQVDSLFDALDPIVAGITKAQLDSILGDYYTKAQTDGLLAAKADTATVNKLVTDMADAQTKLTKALTDIVNLDKRLKDAEDGLKVAQDSVNSYATRIKALEDAVAKIKSCTCDYAWVKDSINAHRTDIDKALADAKASLDSADLQYGYITNLQKLVNEFMDRYDNDTTAIWNKLREMQQAIDAKVDTTQLREVRDEALANHKKALAYSDSLYKQAIDSLQNNLDDSVEVINTKLGTLNDKIDQVQKNLADSVAELKQSIAETNEKVAENAAAIKQLNDQFKQVLKSLITGIIVQGTSNPIFGSVSAPFGVQSNILAAFYGKAIQEVDFPTNNSSKYVDASEAIKASDFKNAGTLKGESFFIENGEVIFNEKEGNAGRLYLTVNPTNRDFTGTTFALENSKGEESPIQLGALNACNEELAFGISHARTTVGSQSANGFYVANATLDKSDIEKVKVKINTEALSDVKDILVDAKNNKGLNLSGLATGLFKSVRTVHLPAYGATAQWTDSLNETIKVTSQYALAATAVKPMSYNTLHDVTFQNVPGVQRLKNFIDDIINKVKIEEPGFIDQAKKLKAKGGIQVKGISQIKTEGKEYKTTVTVEFSDSFDVKATATVSGSVGGAEGGKVHVFGDWYEEDENGVQQLKGKWSVLTAAQQEAEKAKGTASNYYVGTGFYENAFEASGSASGKVPVTFEKDIEVDITEEVVKMINEFNEKLAESGDVVDVTDLNNMLFSIADFDLQSIVTDAIDSVKDPLYDIIDKWNKRLVKFFNVNNYMQPLVLASNSSKTALLSRNSAKPTRMTGTKMTLALTSYNAEIIAPAFKKWVAVTNVKPTGSDWTPSLAAAVNTANADLNKVLDGKQIRVSLKGLTAGYTYEISYSAVDYTGIVVGRKYYIKVK